MHRLQEIRSNQAAQLIELELCRRDAVYWFNSWVWTYNPKNAGTDLPTYLPFDLFPRQEELVRFLDRRLAAREDGLIEKSRDIGFTWIAAGYAVHKWLFVAGFKTMFGSRNSELVDKIGNQDTIFEKIRQLLRALPPWMMPAGFSPAAHDNLKRLINPANENTIGGEGGDEMGRGGRSTMYFLDEAAFFEHPDRVDSATSANSDVRIWGSTVNGMGNLFARKRHSGSLRADQIFRFHWTADPRKSPAWAEQKKKDLTDAWKWASEYDIDYSASVEGICIPAKWVESAKRIAGLLEQRGMRIEPSAKGIGGLDVGAGKAKSVLVPRFGSVVLAPTAWGDPDTTETAFRALDAAQAAGPARADGKVCAIRVMRYDEVGVGKGVRSTLTHHRRQGLTTVPINVGVPPSDTTWPDGVKSEEMFGNLKAELWWVARDRFKSTHEMVLWLEGTEGGQQHTLSDLIALPPDSAGADAQQLAVQLSLVKWFRNEKGRIVIETKQQLAARGIASPDYAEALMLTFDTDSTMEDWLGAYAA